MNAVEQSNTIWRCQQDDGQRRCPRYLRHISARHPERPDRYFPVAFARAGTDRNRQTLSNMNTIQSLSGAPTLAPNSERVIHGEIFRATS